MIYIRTLRFHISCNPSSEYTGMPTVKDQDIIFQLFYNSLSLSVPAGAAHRQERTLWSTIQTISGRFGTSAGTEQETNLYLP